MLRTARLPCRDGKFNAVARKRVAAASRWAGTSGFLPNLCAVELPICRFHVCTRTRGGDAGYSLSGASSGSQVSDRIRSTGHRLRISLGAVRWGLSGRWTCGVHQAHPRGRQIGTSSLGIAAVGHGPRFLHTFPRAGAAVRRSATKRSDRVR